MIVRLFRLGAALALAAAGCGCVNNNFDAAGAWFSKPLDLIGRKGGYTYSNLDEKNTARPITTDDLIDASGACPRAPSPMPPAAPAAADSAGANAPDTSAEMATFIGAGVAIGMSECDVVTRLGRPSAINFGGTAGAERSVVLTYQAGPRPGIYRFAGGRLKEMDSVEPPPAPPKPPKKRSAGKKPAHRNESPAAAGKS